MMLNRFFSFKIFYFKILEKKKIPVKISTFLKNIILSVKAAQVKYFKKENCCTYLIKVPWQVSTTCLWNNCINFENLKFDKEKILEDSILFFTNF